MYAMLAPFDDVCGRQQRQSIKPKARRLCFPVPKHPRMNDLVRLANLAADELEANLEALTNGKVLGLRRGGSQMLTNAASA